MERDRPLAVGEVLLTKSSSDYTSLGGIPEGAVNKVSSLAESTDGGAVYAALPRPPNLPSHLNFKVRSANKDAKAAFQKLWDGNFHATWTLVNKTKFTVHAEALLVADSNTSTTDGGGIKERFAGPLVLFEFVQRPEGILSLNYECTKKNAEFSAAFKETTKLDLSYRILYHFLRSHGTLLMTHGTHDGAIRSTHDSYSLVNSACTMLEQTFKDDVETILDIAMLRCDLAINHNVSDSRIGLAQIKVGEVLEGMGEFSKAALLYLHTAETYFVPSSAKNMANHAACQTNAGLAYKRDNQLEKAEEAYICALHFQRRCLSEGGGGGTWDLNHPETTSQLTNMLVLFDALHKENARSSIEEPDATIFAVFCALLFTAGFQAGSGGLAHYLVMELGSDFAPTCLKREIRQSRGRAMKALVAATARPDKALFRSVLADCAPPNTRIYISGMGHRDSDQERLTDVQFARNLIGSGTDNNKVPVEPYYRCGYRPCSNAENGTGNLKNCPCRSKSYCQKSCQVADWAEHKKVCPWNAKRKEERKAAQA